MARLDTDIYVCYEVNMKSEVLLLAGLTVPKPGESHGLHKSSGLVMHGGKLECGDQE